MTSDIALASSSLPTQIDQELVLLETLKELLTVAMGSLSGGEAGNLMEVGRQIGSTADDLMALASHLGHLPLNPEEQQQRRILPGDVAALAPFDSSAAAFAGAAWRSGDLHRGDGSALVLIRAAWIPATLPGTERSRRAE